MRPDQVLSQLHTLVAEKLIDKIASGEASAAELSVAVKFLKDNGIDADKLNNPEIGKLADTLKLPFDDDEALDELYNGRPN